jgi:hypothetical protein
MIYTFREVAIVYTTIEAENDEQAWQELERHELTIPDCVEVDVLECSIHDIE